MAGYSSLASACYESLAALFKSAMTRRISISATPAIISGVGLSPLVLAFVGILHES
jgi:hypothetical protein